MILTQNVSAHSKASTGLTSFFAFDIKFPLCYKFLRGREER